MKNTLLSMLRPSSLDENETREETKAESLTFATTQTTKETTNEMYNTGVNYDFLNSNIFVNEGDRVKVCIPTDFEDSQLIGDAIKAGKIVILMLDEVEKGTDQRILDMVTGVCFAYGIAIEKMKEKQYLIDPNHKRTNRSYR